MDFMVDDIDALFVLKELSFSFGKDDFGLFLFRTDLAKSHGQNMHNDEHDADQGIENNSIVSVCAIVIPIEDTLTEEGKHRQNKKNDDIGKYSVSRSIIIYLRNTDVLPDETVEDEIQKGTGEYGNEDIYHKILFSFAIPETDADKFIA